jgi:preprotein translocase subunit SecA
MKDLQSTFAEKYLRVQVTAEPAPMRAAPPPPPPPSEPLSATDELFAAPVRTPPREQPVIRSSAGQIGGGPAIQAVGRNDPCPCGSGKKYKKCHGAGG